MIVLDVIIFGVLALVVIVFGVIPTGVAIYTHTKGGPSVRQSKPDPAITRSTTNKEI